MPEENICSTRQVATGRVNTKINEYAKLREMVVGEERDRLSDLRVRLDEFESELTERVGDRIVEAIETRSKEDSEADNELGLALRGPVEHAIRSSITKDRAELSKTLFPIMGPATRDYVTSLFRSMAEDLNEVIQNTTSIKRLGWRLEAKLAGKPFSEYLLVKTLDYRVEEIYLMQPNTGMLLQHVVLDGADLSRDADVVSGMFSAIRSFVQDSFGSGDGDTDEGFRDDGELGGFTFGNRQVIIEAGPSAIIAASVDGNPPPQFRSQLEGILEELQANHAEKLDNFSGDLEEMAFTREILQPAMIENRPKEESGSGMWRVWLTLGLVLLGLVTWGVVAWKKEKRVQQFIAKVESQPGIEAVRLDGKKRITGLRDPLSADPQQLAKDFGFEADRFEFEFVPFHSVGTNFDQQRRDFAAAKEERIRRSIEAEMTERSRAVAMAQINSQFGGIDGLEIDRDQAGMIRLSGTVPEPAYSDILRGIQPYTAVFSGIDTSGLENTNPQEIERLTEVLETAQINFISGTSDLAEGTADELSRLAATALELGQLAGLEGRELRLELRAKPLSGANEAYLKETALARLAKARKILLGNGLPERFISEIAIDEERTYINVPGSVYLVPFITPSD